MSPRAIVYWVATGLLVAEFVVGGMFDALHLPPFFPIFGQLGYPAYFANILGVWKVLGAAAVLAPGLPRLKEWAYAGMVFDLTGAAVSNLVGHGDASDLASALAFLPVVAASWALRPPARRDLASMPWQRRSSRCSFGQVQQVLLPVDTP